MAQLRPEQWKEVGPYLDQALTLPEAERAAWLEAFREKNRTLADLVQTLLDEHRSLAKEHFLEKGPATDHASIVGSKLGPYQIEAPLGSGGIGGSLSRARQPVGPRRGDQSAAVEVFVGPGSAPAV